MGQVISVSFGANARRAQELYAHASGIDDDPSRVAEAEECYRRAIALDPKLAGAYTNLGALLVRRGDEAGGERLFLQALALDPHQPEASYDLGFVYLGQHRVDAAIVCFVRSLKDDPEFAEAHYNLAVALEQSGKSAEANVHWRTYLQIAPQGEWAKAARACLRASGPELRALGPMTPEEAKRAKRDGRTVRR
jgi:tetratricopeptide (TPR) repeat protein